MEKFKIGDKVYADDWCYGKIVEIKGDIAYVKFETERGGGCLNFELSELRHEKWCITTDYFNKKKIDYLAWQNPVFLGDDGYFWARREAFEKILHNSTPDHPFLFNTRREAIRHLKSIDIPQKCRIIRWV